MMSLRTFANALTAALFCEKTTGRPVVKVALDVLGADEDGVPAVPVVWGDAEVVLAFTTDGEDVAVGPAFPVA